MRTTAGGELRISETEGMIEVWPNRSTVQPWVARRAADIRRAAGTASKPASVCRVREGSTPAARFVSVAKSFGGVRALRGPLVEVVSRLLA